MLVADMFNRLSLGELSNLSISNNGDGDIVEARKPQLITYANRVLRQIYSRFELHEKTLLLQTLEWKTDYHLHPDHAVSNLGTTTEEHLYILDHADDPFLGDLIRVLDAQDSRGWDLKINVAHDVRSIYTPRWDMVQVPYPLCGQVLSINYQAEHAKLLDEDESQVIELPHVLEEPFIQTVASFVFGAMSSQEGIAKSQELLARAENILTMIEEKDLVSSSRTSHYNKFIERGFA